MNCGATWRIYYIYKYDDNTYWKITSYVDNVGGFIVPIYATNYSYGMR